MIRTFLSPAEQCPILLQRKVDLDEICASQQLHDHARGNDWCDAEFHESTAIRGEDDSHPVKRVRRVGGHDAIQRDLGADQENEKRNGCP